MFTSFGQYCINIMKTVAPNLFDYYDEYSGNCIIPLGVYKGSSVMQEEGLALIMSDSYIYKGEVHNWVLEKGIIVDDYGNSIQAVNFRMVESFC